MVTSCIFNQPTWSSMENGLTINKAYAEKYVKRKQAEELSKLKEKYGDYGSDSSSSSSEEEDENADEVTVDIERDFLCTLSLLKGRDPRIYDQSTTFFTESKSKKAGAASADGDGKADVQQAAPMYLKDYERQRLLERGSLAEVSDSDDDEPSLSLTTTAPHPTYHEEQRELKESFKAVVGEVLKEEGDLLTLREKTAEEEQREEVEYVQWLRGEEGREVLRQEEEDMVALRNYWADPDLDADEAFLRDYILKKGYLDKEDDNRIPTYEEVVDSEVEGQLDDSEDEEALDVQEDFERKYNFRFEEPGGDLITSYPRTIAGSVRKPDDIRKTKRRERLERKEREKEEQREELKRLRNLKKKEVMERLSKISDATGNPMESLGLTVEDLEKDFDPSEYDSKMDRVFGESYYIDQLEEEKPVFSDFEEEDELVDWDPWHQPQHGSTEELHCEDSHFNMDADYDPANLECDPSPSVTASSSKLRRRKKLSKFATAVKRSKPTFDPKERAYDEYLEEHYKLTSDPVNTFKYRTVMPNDFGLSTDEVLMSSNKELNSWVSLSKSVKLLTEEEERTLQRRYRKKGRDWKRKEQILTTFYKSCDSNETNSDETGMNESTKHKKNIQSVHTDKALPETSSTSDGTKKKKTIKRKQKYKQNKSTKLSATRMKSYGL